MDFLRNKFKSMNLKAAFTLVILLTLAVSLIFSALTVVAGAAFQQWLYPQKDRLSLQFQIDYTNDSSSVFYEKIETGDEIFLLNGNGTRDVYSEGRLSSSGGYIDIDNSSAIEKMTITAEHIVPSTDSLTPKRKLAYGATSVLMVILPLLYSFFGVLFCTFWFYNRKLAVPIEILKKATEHISSSNLDFSVKYDSTDEMGLLCSSFETMRAALKCSSKKQWELIDSQRTLRACIAHDLRNPIAIIQGYIEHLQIQLSAKTLTGEKLTKALNNLESASCRLERYMDSVMEISMLEEIEVQRSAVILPDAVSEMAEDFRVVAKANGLNMNICCSCEPREALIDICSLNRVLENIFLNSVRFAEKAINFTCETKDEHLVITILDDGNGFSQDVLKNQRSVFHSKNDGHMGLGLLVCHTLCRKNNWEIVLKNATNSSGASVSVTIKI